MGQMLKQIPRDNPLKPVKKKKLEEFKSKFPENLILFYPKTMT
jgi:hypothetical protein